MTSTTIRYNYICIEGNIGAGKTSLATMLAEKFNGKLILEQFEDNPFLPKFYQDPEKYAFPLELSFLASRFQQLKDQIATLDLFKSFVIADYIIHKSMIFARRTLPDDEFALFSRLFRIMAGMIPKPELLVYLHVDVQRLQENIKHRGRSYEQQIGDNYLKSIQEGYLEYLRFQTDIRVLLLDTNNIDFVENPADFARLVELINREHPGGVHRYTL